MGSQSFKNNIALLILGERRPHVAVHKIHEANGILKLICILFIRRNFLYANLSCLHY